MPGERPVLCWKNEQVSGIPPVMSQEKIVIRGGNLFQIAATELGSALQWINLARYNNIADPFISGPMDLYLPPFSAVMDDGLGPQ